MKLALLRDRGVSLIEVIIALSLFSLVIVSTWGIFFEIDSSVLKNTLAIEAIQAVHNIIKSNFLSHATIPARQRNYITPCLFEYSEIRASVEGRIVVVDSDQLGKLGHDCGGYPNFKNVMTTSVTETPFFLEHAEATDVDIFKKHFFVSMISQEGGGHVPAVVMGDIEKGATDLHYFYLGSGFNSLDVADGTIFGAVKDISDQLAIIDTHNGTGLSLLATSTLPGVAGVRPEGWSIFYYDKKVYIGTRRTAGNEFHVFDVSNPRSPVWLGSREINHNINDIVVRPGLAYLATSGNSKDLIVLDVSSPSSIHQILSLDLPGNEDGRSLALLGDKLYLGRFKSTIGNPDFYVLDVSSVRAGSTISILGSYTFSADVNTISVQHDFAIVGTSKVGANLQVLNIASSTHILPVTSLPTNQKVTGIDYEDDEVFASIFGSENVLRVRFDE